MSPGAVDVLVVGAGAAGMTAGLAASARGLKVLIVEATNQVGGTTATSAGTLWIPCGLPGEGEGEGECVERARGYLEAAVGSSADRNKIDAFLNAGPELLRFLRDETDVRLEPVSTHPDYLQSLPGATLGGRAFAPTGFDGRRLGPHFDRVRPPLPEFMVLGGMMVSKADIPVLLDATRHFDSFVRAAGLVARHAVDRLRHLRGTRLVMGNALVAQLLSSVLRAKVAIAFDTKVTRLTATGGGFSGLLSSADGETTPIRVGRAVVLATGGFSGNAEMRKRWLPALAQPHSVAHAGNSGGGIELGLKLGAALEDDHRSPAFWMPVSTMKRADGSDAVFPHIILDRAKPGLLAVDATGQRFSNEADSYHHFCEAMLDCARRTGSERFFLVADAAFVERYGIGMVRAGLKSPARFVKAGYLVAGSSPRELAARMAVDGTALEETIARYNANAADGVDPEFHRGESALNRHNGDGSHTPSPCLRPLELGMLYSVEVKVADLGTSVGLATDANAQVLGTAGEPIHGLYACGNDMASIMRGAYPGPGTTLGPGMVFAWRAARHIAAA